MLAEEAYGVKTTRKDLLRFVEAQLGIVETDDKVTQAMATTRTSHYRVGAMTQALVWEQYRYPVALDDLLAGNSGKMALETHPVEPIEPPLAPQAEVWINKTGSTKWLRRLCGVFSGQADRNRDPGQPVLPERGTRKARLSHH